MFSLHFDKNGSANKVAIIESDDSRIRAKIDLNKGASLCELVLDGCDIISPSLRDYDKSFDSAILFPFSNRIKDSSYEFNGKTYHLNRNFAQEDVAIHGIVYNKEFQIDEQNITNDSAMIKLKFEEKHPDRGFPFLYTFGVTYKFTKNKLSLEVNVINKDNVHFPFSLGWHPYFNTKNLKDTFLTINGEHFNRHAVDSEEKTEQTHWNSKVRLGEKNLDDCFKLDDDQILFETPDYEMKLSSSGKEGFLQLFTPDSQDSLAIEPMTAPPNSLNNKINLYTLAPQQQFNLKWKLEVRCTKHQ